MLSPPPPSVTVIALVTVIVPVIDSVVGAVPVALMVNASPAVTPPAVKLRTCAVMPEPSFSVTRTSPAVAVIAPRMVI